MSGEVVALVGAQFGSEGKGMIAEKIAGHYDVHVRTGAPNAGHTYYTDKISLDGSKLGRQKVIARSIPCGAANRDAILVIGAGGLIDVELLLQEAFDLDVLGLDVSGRLLVDYKTMLIDPVRHHKLEGGVNGDAHRLIGSTGEGVGPARMAKIARGTFVSPRPAWSTIEQVGQIQERLSGAGIVVCDTAAYLNEQYDRGAAILLEGTQGSGLSLTHGPWPYVTSSDTNAATLAADAGLAPRLVDSVILVMRSFPIRVAGNSGPLPLETTWSDVGREAEHTTVTGKVRRVGKLYPDTVRRAIMLNRPNVLAMTFADYLWPSLFGRDTIPIPAPDALYESLEDIENRVGMEITILGTGPDTMIELYRGRHVTAAEEWPSSFKAYAMREGY